MHTTPSSPRGIRAATLLEAFHMTVSRRRDRVAVRTVDDAVSVTWGELRARADRLAGGLRRLGVDRGDTLGLLIGNRPEFNVCDLAAMTLGATPFSIYNTLAPEQIEYVVADAGARVLITEQAFLAKALEVRARLKQVLRVVVVNGEAPEGCIPLLDLESDDPRFDAAGAAAQVQPDDLATLIYTSGTTGPPKGVQLSHRGIMTWFRSFEQVINLPTEGRVISWLPAAHAAERLTHHYLPLVSGLEITICPDPRDIVQFLPRVRPMWFFAVPRIWEKLRAKVETAIDGLPAGDREAAQAGLKAAVKCVRLAQRGEDVPSAVAATAEAAEARFFAGWRELLGLDRATILNTGAAPTALEVLEFFHAIGLPVSELWGMTETTSCATFNPPGRIRLGTVGPPLPGVELKLAEDGEILVRFAGAMVGYWNQPEKTREAFTDEGWLLTGDVGAFDDAGYLKIVDRKKDLIINAAGKNMSPANIEAAVKSASPLIGQACCIGDRRPYNTALIVLDAEFAPAWAARQGIAAKSLSELARDARVRMAVQTAVDVANDTLARPEQIKKFHIVRGDWLPSGDEMTPTMKLKRKPIAAKYAAEIEQMYA